MLPAHSTTLPRQRSARPATDTPPSASLDLSREGTALRWRARATCVGHDPRLFDPPAALEGAGAARRRLRAGAEVCRGCPVADACLVDAIEHGDIGLRGGLLLTRDAGDADWTYRVRRVDLDVQDLQPCGTYAAWRRHRRRGELVDAACAAARAAYQAQHCKSAAA
jgi:hypothetical protein